MRMRRHNHAVSVHRARRYGLVTYRRTEHPKELGQRRPQSNLSGV